MVHDRAAQPRWLVVRIGETKRAILAGEVQAVLPARMATRLPMGSAALAGITLFRGRVIPMVLPPELASADSDPASRGPMVVIDHAGGFGLVVSEVLGMIEQEAAGEIRWARRAIEPLDPVRCLDGGLISGGEEEELKPEAARADHEKEGVTSS